MGQTIPTPPLPSLHISTENFTNNFLPGIGVIGPEKSDRMYQGIDDTELCAKLCLEEKSFTCFSFDFCPARQQCFISRSDGPGVPVKTSTERPECTNYRRNIYWFWFCFSFLSWFFLVCLAVCLLYILLVCLFVWMNFKKIITCWYDIKLGCLCFEVVKRV